VIRLPADQISVTVSRVTSGVRLMRVVEGTRVVSVAMTPRSAEDGAETAEESIPAIDGEDE
jgi:hypothetical protein